MMVHGVPNPSFCPDIQSVVLVALDDALGKVPADLPDWG
jgi:hypothetical protein